jgi:DNA-binding MarR family transcriptional regulator
MTSATRRPDATKVPAEQVDALMRVSRAFVGMAAASIAAVDDVVTVAQLRVLMMMSTRGPLNLLAVAEALEFNPSNASRICDRLMKAGLLDRGEDPVDRRNVTLTLTAEGRALVNRVTRHRRTAITRILRTMSAAERQRLCAALDRFATAAGEPADDQHIGLIGAQPL